MWYVEMGGMYQINSQNVFGRKIYTTIDKKSEVRQKFNNTDVYATVFQYDNENQNDSNLFGPMYLDLDMEFHTNLEYSKLKADLSRIVIYLNLQYGIPTEFIKFYFTGKKGFHLIIPAKVFNIRPDKNLNVYYKAIAKELSENTIEQIIDLKIYDKKRLFRLPNSINGKTGLYKVPITFEDIMKLSYEDIKEYSSLPKEVTHQDVSPVDKAINKLTAIKSSIKEAEIKRKKKLAIPTNVDLSKITFPSCIQEIYKTGCAEGNRNNTTIILASAFFQKGVDYETTFSIINKWNNEKNDPALSDGEIQTTVMSAYQQVQSGRRYGCSSIRDMDLCVGKECKIYK